MKVAFTIWKNRISPVADSAREVLVLDIEGLAVLGRRHERFRNQSLFDRAEKLVDMGVNTFICGAISDFYSGLIEGYGIHLIPFIHGQIDEVVDAFMNESLGGVCRRME